MIDFEDFQKLDIRIGTIVDAGEIEDADSLLKLTVDTGEEASRTLVAGVKDHVDGTDELVGTQVPVIVNMEPKEMFGVESEGMMLIAEANDQLAFLHPHRKIEPGAEIQ
jgi:methionyl-tRNA synthetase